MRFKKIVYGIWMRKGSSLEKEKCENEYAVKAAAIHNLKSTATAKAVLL